VTDLTESVFFLDRTARDRHFRRKADEGHHLADLVEALEDTDLGQDRRDRCRPDAGNGVRQKLSIIDFRERLERP
jgi:hypothetical protein